MYGKYLSISLSDYLSNKYISETNKQEQLFKNQHWILDGWSHEGKKASVLQIRSSLSLAHRYSDRKDLLLLAVQAAWSDVADQLGMDGGIRTINQPEKSIGFYEK